VSPLAHLLPHVLAAAEPSKTPFYVAGGALAAWAVILASLGFARAGFPGSAGRMRAVIALSATLVLATVATAVATSTKPEHERAIVAGAELKGKPLAQPGGAPTAPAPTATTPATPAPGGGASTLELAADPSGQLKFDQTSLAGKAGKLTIDLTNDSPVPHNVAVEQAGKQLGVSKTVSGGKATLSLDLKAGSYAFYCAVPGHRQAGMEGTLEVT